jgi:peptidoglycan/LPS O-acetylase OafA/YrhL
MALLAPHLPPPGVGVDLVHLWSLAVEEQFYLLWPFVVWHVRDRVQLLRLCIGLGFAALLLRCGLVALGVAPDILYQLLPTRADSLLCGAALALMVRRPGGHALSVRWILPLSGVAALGVFLIDGNGGHETRLMSTIGYTLIAIVCGCLVLGAQRQRGWITRLCDHAPLRFFGRYSYGLYLYHGVLLVYLVGWLAPLQRLTGSAMAGGVMYLLLSLAVCMGVAMLSYHLVEAPILRWKRRFA